MEDQLWEAIQRNDMNSIRMFMSTNEAIFLDASKAWKESPLMVALKCESNEVAVIIARRFPDFALEKGKGRCTTLHLACENNNLAITKVLLNIAPELCLVSDRKLAIPLHVAIRKGCGQDVIMALITTSPNSFEKITSKEETVFHLALKHGHCALFLVLVEQSKKLKLEHLLHKKDRQGNNALHIASRAMLTEPMKLLLPPKSSCGIALVRVNSLNRSGLTALDIYNRSNKDSRAQEIESILLNAGAMEASSLPIISHLKQYLETKVVFLTLLGIMKAAAFGAVFNIPSPLLEGCPAKGAILYAGDLTLGQIPLILYFMVLNTALLLVSVGGSIALLWSLAFRTIVIFVAATFVAAYAIAMHSVMPKFYVRFGSGIDIPSSILVGILATTTISSVAVAHYMVKYIKDIKLLFAN